MADFGTHLAWGAIGSGLAATATFAADIVPAREIMALTAAGVIGSVLPDIDLEKAVPSRMLFTGLAIVLGFLALFQFRASYSITELWIIWGVIFAGIRYGAYNLFHRRTRHRGIFHSLVAGAFFGAITAALAHHALGEPPLVAWLTGMFVAIGVLIHLILDEIYSVDFEGAQLKKSFGSAIKPWDGKNIGASLAMAAALGLAVLVAPSWRPFYEVVNFASVASFLRERMVPQGGWFQMRSAVVAARLDAGPASAPPAVVPGETAGTTQLNPPSPVPADPPTAAMTPSAPALAPADATGGLPR